MISTGKSWDGDLAVIGRIIAISALALCAGSFVESARSAQLFVCDGGKAIQIDAAELEAAKRTNRCVARHFGLSVETTAPSAAKVSLRTSIATLAPGMVVQIDLPVRKPRQAPLRTTVPTHQKTGRSHSSNRMAKAAPVDFRKVRIINATPGSEKWFNHRR